MITQRLWFSLALAGVLIALPLALGFAQANGFVAHDLTMRITMIAIGLSIVIYANAAPKSETPLDPAHQGLRRVSGWAFTLSGIAYAAVWAIAPISVAALACMVPVALALAFVVGYCSHARTRREPGSNQSAR